MRDQSRVRNDAPAVRLANGRELACITLSGYRVGVERSPEQWRDLIVESVNRTNKASDALSRIQKIMSGKRWDAATMDEIAAVVRAAGLEIADADG